MKSIKKTFTNLEGTELSGRLEFPLHQKPIAFALFAHCFTCNKNLTAISNISRSLTSRGIAVLRFDFTGLGESDGDFEETNFTNNIDDLVAAATFLETEYQAPNILIGHSLGGAAAIFAANRIPSVNAVATIGAPADPSHVKHLIKTAIPEIERMGKAQIDIGGRPFVIQKQFIDNLENQGMSKELKRLKRPILILHSPQDNTVSISNAASIYTAAMHPKSFISLDGADHLLSRKEDSLYAGEIIASWASRYLAMPESTILETDKQVVTRIGESGFTTDIMAGIHGLLADEPASSGGKGLGPSPYDYILAGLGACTAMTLRLYADHKKWDLQEVRVHLQHEKVHANDCEECETKPVMLDRVERHIEIEGNLDDTQRNRLVEIANKCPVHKTLASEVVVETFLV